MKNIIKAKRFLGKKISSKLTKEQILLESIKFGSFSGGDQIIDRVFTSLLNIINKFISFGLNKDFSAVTKRILQRSTVGADKGVSYASNLNRLTYRDGQFLKYNSNNSNETTDQQYLTEAEKQSYIENNEQAKDIIKKEDITSRNLFLLLFVAICVQNGLVEPDQTKDIYEALKITLTVNSTMKKQEKSTLSENNLSELLKILNAPECLAQLRRLTVLFPPPRGNKLFGSSHKDKKKKEKDKDKDKDDGDGDGNDDDADDGDGVDNVEDGPLLRKLLQNVNLY